jgi:hypothetical protein
MLTNVQKDIHNDIQYSWGRLEMLFIKQPFEIIVGPDFENAGKTFDKSIFPMRFSRRKRKGHWHSEGKLIMEKLSFMSVRINHVNAYH